jgi:hypothetical protein
MLSVIHKKTGTSFQGADPSGPLSVGLRPQTTILQPSRAVQVPATESWIVGPQTNHLQVQEEGLPLQSC